MATPASQDSQQAPPEDPAPPRVSRRGLLGFGFAALALAGSWAAWQRAARFPPDTTPGGAYLRIAVNVTEGKVRDCFAYLEDQAQHAAYSIRDYRKKASDRIAASYPEPERSRLLDAYHAHATAPDGADVWLEMAQRRGWVGRLRRDLSGVARVEIERGARHHRDGAGDALRVPAAGERHLGADHLHRGPPGRSRARRPRRRGGGEGSGRLRAGEVAHPPGVKEIGYATLT